MLDTTAAVILILAAPIILVFSSLTLLGVTITILHYAKRPIEILGKKIYSMTAFLSGRRR